MSSFTGWRAAQNPAYMARPLLFVLLSAACELSGLDWQRGNANRATFTVARELVAYLVASDRRQREFLAVDRHHG
jgi:hypothetical protein